MFMQQTLKKNLNLNSNRSAGKDAEMWAYCGWLKVLEVVLERFMMLLPCYLLFHKILIIWNENKTLENSFV